MQKRDNTGSREIKVMETESDKNQNTAQREDNCEHGPLAQDFAYNGSHFFNSQQFGRIVAEFLFKHLSDCLITVFRGAQDNVLYSQPGFRLPGVSDLNDHIFDAIFRKKASEMLCVNRFCKAVFLNLATGKVDSVSGALILEKDNHDAEQKDTGQDKTDKSLFHEIDLCFVKNPKHRK